MRDAPKTHLGLALIAVAFGGAMSLLLLAIVGISIAVFVALLPWPLGAVGLYHAVRAHRLPGDQREDIEDRGKRALHFSIFSLSVSGILARRWGSGSPRVIPEP